MSTQQTDLWARFKRHYFWDAKAGIGLDISRMKFSETFLDSMTAPMAAALQAMAELEGGAIANPDEKRMVGHYWLRAPELAPNKDLRRAIEETLESIVTFAGAVHSGSIRPSPGATFAHLLVVGIGGSALGPQLVSRALATATDRMSIHFFDNTDPDGMNRAIREIPDLARALCLIISKSGGTKETRNGQLVAKAAFAARGIPFAGHFVAVTGEGSELDKTAVAEKWLARFPMWDWVGGRTSELSAVGLLPAALQGIDVRAMLAGARRMDTLTRCSVVSENPAALLALMWHHAGGGLGRKDMVVLPYKDRLELMSRYLQQLVMESLGKELDRAGKKVHQGIAVYGNKGSTDQHAYVQQLRDGLNNFFAIFLEVLTDRDAPSPNDQPGDGVVLEVEPGVTSGDYLHGFYLGTRSALYESNRESITITIQQVSAESVGMLIALFERAVGIYAELININAYHQPGVEAGKKAAAAVLSIQQQLFVALRKQQSPVTVEALAAAMGSADEHETLFKVLQRLVANGRVIAHRGGEGIFNITYAVAGNGSAKKRGADF